VFEKRKEGKNPTLFFKILQKACNFTAIDYYNLNWGNAVTGRPLSNGLGGKWTGRHWLHGLGSGENACEGTPKKGLVAEGVNGRLGGLKKRNQNVTMSIGEVIQKFS